ncbi:MAG: hypothetical protein U9Q78_06670 [Chloroflexota bacterium]|nr:hypothetical protein [Chloroflexota bacterium]
MIKRQTQQFDYWKEFSVTEGSLEHLYELFLEGEEPHTSEELALALIRSRYREEEDRLRQKLSSGEIFQPRNSYPEGTQLIFPALGYELATVVGKRPGHSVRYGDFTVIQAQFAEGGPTREFASELEASHPLNLEKEGDILASGDLLSPKELYSARGDAVASTLEETLAESEDFVHWNDEWYLRELMPDLNEGHRNIVEAVIEVEGEPMEAEGLLPKLDLSDEFKPRAQVFALNYSLAHDERFEDVGPAGQVRWFLRRMEPEEVHEKPPRLRCQRESYDPTVIRPDMLDWVQEFADELIEPELQPTWEPEQEETTLVLTYPHRRAGTLPLTPQTTPFFPQKEDGPVHIYFRHPQSKTRWPGWVVAQEGYVYGLRQWYDEASIPAGTYITLRRGADPLEVLIECQQRRLREWVRVAQVRDGKLTFEMQSRSVSWEYDDLMLISEAHPSPVPDQVQAKIDRVWQRAEEERRSIFTILCEIFPELSKLNPQGTVHVKTLYAAVNVIRRFSPGPILAELSTRACFLPVGDGYWSYHEEHLCLIRCRQR